MGPQEEVLKEELAQEGGVDEYAGTEKFSTFVGGKRKKGSKSKSRKSRKGKKMKKGKKGTRKGKRPPSKWIMHVKAFCKKTGKKFPEALKDPMCRKTFKH